VFLRGVDVRGRGTRRGPGPLRYREHTLNTSANCYIVIRYFPNGKCVDDYASSLGMDTSLLSVDRGHRGSCYNFELYYYANKQYYPDTKRWSPTNAPGGTCRYYLCEWFRRSFGVGGVYKNKIDKNIFVRGGDIKAYWDQLRADGSTASYSRSGLSNMYQRYGFEEMIKDSPEGDTLLIAPVRKIIRMC
jgi:hypothetical protein